MLSNTWGHSGNVLSYLAGPVFYPARNPCFASSASSGDIDDTTADENTKTRLRVRAAHHGRSMEEEAREILRSALTASSPVKGNLAEAIQRRFAAFGGLEFELPRRDAIRQGPEFAE